MQGGEEGGGGEGWGEGWGGVRGDWGVWGEREKGRREEGGGMRVEAQHSTIYSKLK